MDKLVEISALDNLLCGIFHVSSFTYKAVVPIYVHMSHAHTGTGQLTVRDVASKLWHVSCVHMYNPSTHIRSHLYAPHDAHALVYVYMRGEVGEGRENLGKGEGRGKGEWEGRVGVGDHLHASKET